MQGQFHRFCLPQQSCNLGWLAEEKEAVEKGFFSPPPFTGSFLPTSVQLDLTTQATREMAWVLSVQGQGMCVGVGVGEWILL